MLSKAKNSDFKINAGTSSATLSYERYGKRYSLYVPYHKGSIVTASKVKVFLVKDDQRIEITQQPGIPYLVTAAHLGGSKIIVVNGDVQTEYEADQYPRL